MAITYADKVQVVVNPLPDVNQWRAVDANEVKNEVNVNITATGNAASAAAQAISDAAAAQSDADAAGVAAAAALSAASTAQGDIDTHEGLTNNPHSVTKSQVGLANADNTSDVDKPVSTAQQAALDLKLDELYNIQTAKTSDYTFAVSDSFSTIPFSSASPITGIIPLNSSQPFLIGSWIYLTSTNTGAVTVSVVLGVTLTSQSGNFIIPVEGFAMLLKVGTDTWKLYNGSPALSWTPFTPGFTGFSVNPTSLDCKYIREGTKWTLNFYMVAGTSNASTFTLTGLPVTASKEQYWQMLALNAGATANARGTMLSGSTTLQIFLVPSASFTASGGKAVYGCIIIEGT